MNQTSQRERPLVSVIIPTHNRPEYLKAAIESVLSQTYFHFEIIVSDDCSRISPEPIVRGFQDDRIRFRRNDRNLGIGLNATYAFMAAKGQYVASLNDDDLWGDRFLETLIELLEKNDKLAIAFCDYYVINEGGQVDLGATKKRDREQSRHLLKPGIYSDFRKIGLVDQSIFTASAALIRREAVDWNRLSEGGVFWDYYLVYLAFKSGLGAGYCAERLGYYRMHKQSVTRESSVQSKIRKAEAGVACHRCFAEDKSLKPYWSYFQKELAHARANLGIGYMRMGKIADARFFLRQSLSDHKLNLRTWTALGLSYLPQILAQWLARVRNPNFFSRAR